MFAVFVLRSVFLLRFKYELSIQKILVYNTPQLLVTILISFHWRGWCDVHILRTMWIVWIEVYRTFALFAINWFAFLLHHHSAPFCSCILKPNLKHQRNTRRPKWFHIKNMRKKKERRKKNIKIVHWKGKQE